MTVTGVRLRASDLDRIGQGIEAQAHAWAKRKADYLPAQWRGAILGQWSERRAENERAGNDWLRTLHADMRQGAGLPMDATDAEIKQAARDAAASMYERAMALGTTLQSVRRGCEQTCVEHGIAAPADDLTDAGAIARMFDSDWWVRKLRAAHGRRIERAAIGLGYVSRAAGCYVSDVNLYRRREQKARNRKALEAAEVENQFGDVFTLQELADRSNANPRVRRAELMTRIAGFEACARDLGHVADFWTVTCPSRFHARRSEDGGRNPKYEEGLTPRDAQAHLVKAWAGCRAALHRRGVRMYGFRIAEPHHDGCPHWHLLCFMPAADVERARAMVRRYFLEMHDPHEPGARAQRCKFVAIDPARAGAAGYVAKYVAKSIDGFGLDQDLLGNPALIAAERVEAWAATWGIRQFQQIGGAPVGVWRELRRMTGDEDLTDAARAAYEASNAGAGKWSAGWAAYMTLQGGPTVERKNLRLRVAYTNEGERWDAVEGCPVPYENRYGEPCAASAWGVRDEYKGAAWASRRFRWKSPAGERAGLGIAATKAAKVARAAQAEAEKAEFLRPKGGKWADEADKATKASEKAQAEADKAHRARLRGSGVVREHRAPWTRVNNCTGDRDERSKSGGCDGKHGGESGGGGAGRGAAAYQGDGRQGTRAAVGRAARDPHGAGSDSGTDRRG